MKLFSSQPKTSSNEFSSLIGQGTAFIGDITFSGTFRIDGHFQGNVRGLLNGSDKDASCFVVSPGGTVIADSIKCFSAIIGGSLQSKEMWIDGEFSLLSTAVITGATIHYRLLHIEQGAKLHRCTLIHLGDEQS